GGDRHRQDKVPRPEPAPGHRSLHAGSLRRAANLRARLAPAAMALVSVVENRSALTTVRVPVAARFQRAGVGGSKASQIPKKVSHRHVGNVPPQLLATDSE